MSPKPKARRPRRKVRVVRARRAASRPDRWTVGRVDVSDAPVGPDVVVPRMEDVLRAFEQAPRGDDWPSVSKLVIPVFPRVRPVPAGYPEPLRALLPPGVVVGFGVDIGLAFMVVSPRQLELLGVSESELITQSLANLVARADEVTPAHVVHDAVGGLPVAALQTGRSIGSTLVLVPDQLARLFGREPRLFVAPMRDLLLGVPPDADPELVAQLFEEFASQDPNCLPPIAFRFDGQSVAISSSDNPPAAARRLLA